MGLVVRLLFCGIVSVALGAEPQPRAGQTANAKPAAAPEAAAAFADAERLRKEWWVGDRTQRATEKYNVAVSRWRAVNDRRGEARALLGLCGFNVLLTEYQEALVACGQALDLARASGDREHEGRVLVWLSTVHTFSGDSQTAAALARQALPLLRSTRTEEEAVALMRVGQGLYDRAEYRSAVEYVNQALALCRASGLRSTEALMLSMLGRIRNAEGDDVAAEHAYRDALRVAREVAGGTEYEAVSLDSLGTIFTSRRQYEEALGYYTQALVLERRRGNRRLEMATLFRMAGVEHTRGNPSAARAHVESAIEILESVRRNVAVDGLRASVQASRQRYYILYIDILMGLHERSPSSGFDRLAFEVSERARARSLLDLLAEGRVEIRRGLPPALKARENHVELQMSAVQRRWQAAKEAGAPSDQIAALEEELAGAEQGRQRLEWEIRGQFREYADLAYPPPLTADRVVPLLDHRTALLEYTLGQTTSFLFVVTNEGVRAHRLADAKEIQQLVTEVRSALSKPGRRELTRYERSARRLYELLVAPAADILATRDTLLIAPDRALHYLPFEALLTASVDPRGAGDDRRERPYLLKRWAVAYVPSASVLASLRERAAATTVSTDASRRTDLVAFADPATGPVSTRSSVADARARDGPGRLMYARDEVKAVAARFKPEHVALYLGDVAREENVKDNGRVASAKFVHFATHGLFDEEQPARSGLLLAADPASREDGLLQVREVFNLQLSADLVVLSACQTGLGKDVRGEGVMGLSRAFLYAGAKSVAVSLWPVADRSTADLMTGLYRALGEGHDRVAALREAKLALIRDTQWSHPYYWAPFALIGDPR